MWTEPKLSLGEYVTALIGTLGEDDPAALIRMKQTVRNRRAGISLDEETVVVYFSPKGLVVEAADNNTSLDGAGSTDSATVVALLAGIIEIPQAILDGRLRVTGELEEIARMFQAIEILLDVSPRSPRLQALAARFLAERSTPDRLPPPVESWTSWYPFPCTGRELDLLRRLDLLPERNTGHLP